MNMNINININKPLNIPADQERWYSFPLRDQVQTQRLRERLKKTPRIVEERAVGKSASEPVASFISCSVSPGGKEEEAFDSGCVPSFGEDGEFGFIRVWCGF